MKGFKPEGNKETGMVNHPEPDAAEVQDAPSCRLKSLLASSFDQARDYDTARGLSRQSPQPPLRVTSYILCLIFDLCWSDYF